MARDNATTTAQISKPAAGAHTEMALQGGSDINLAFNVSDVRSVTMGQDGGLVIAFKDGAVLVLANYASAANGDQPVRVHMADGQTVDLSQLLTTLASAASGQDQPMNNATAAVATIIDTSPIMIEKPASATGVTFKIEFGQTYKLAFDMTDVTTVQDLEGQLVIKFNDGAEIYIPNFGEMKASGDAPGILLSDGTPISLTQLETTLSLSASLSAIEPAAGEVAGAQGAGSNGYGFNTPFTSTDLQSLPYIGPINPTALRYGAEFREPLPVLETEQPPQPVPPNPPPFEVGSLIVYEDGSVAMQIHASPDKTDGSEFITITVTGIDTSWAVDTTTSGGSYNAATGTWTITLAPGATYSGGPTVFPPHDSDADMPGLLHVVVVNTSVDTGLTASASGDFTITTDAVADIPAVVGNDAAGDEDTAIPLDITTAATDIDGSEEITSVVISGVPAGAMLNHGTDMGGGVWQLTQADLAGLTITPPLHWSGDFPLTVTVTAVETHLTDNEITLANNTATNSDTLVVRVKPVADEPDLKVSAKDAQVKEDGSVTLSVSAELIDTDGSEFLTVSISGIAAGWAVDTSASGGTYDAAAGTWTIVLPSGVYSFTGGPTLSPPANSDADLSGLVVTATATESANGDTASASTLMNVITDAVIDAPSIDAADVTGNEDTAIPLTINVSRGDDTADGSEVLSNITVSGVPAGATLNHGTDMGGGVWSLTTADLAGLTITPAHNYNGDFTLTVSVTDTETNLSGSEFDLTDNTATATDTVKVKVRPVDDNPTVRMDDVQVKEDGSVQLVINAGFAPGSVATDYLTITLTGINPAWGVNTATSGGTYNAATGTWTITLAPGTTYAGGPVFSPPANSDADMNGLVATARQFDAANTQLGSASDGARIVTDAVIDAPSIDAADVTGNEDTAIPLTINVSRGDDTADGSEVLSNITVSGVPAGATLNHGTDMGGGVWSLTTADLAGLTITPAHNYNGDFTLTVSVTDTETNLSGSEFDLTDNTATATDTVKVKVRPVDDNPTVRMDDVQVKEDGSVQLVINAGFAPGSVATDYLTITLTGINPAWGVNTATSGGTYNAATGTWTITLAPGTTYAGGPVFSPPANSDADMNGLVATARQFDAANTQLGSASDGARIVTDAVIDAPSIDADDVTGGAGVELPFSINVSRGDDTVDGSEVLSNVIVSGLPADAVLNHGVKLLNGDWSLTSADLAGLTVKTSTSGAFAITVRVTDTETNLSGSEFDLTDNSATVSDLICLTVEPPVFIVGKNVDDKSGSTITYEVGTGTGTITGNGAGDVLVGDVGGSSLKNQDKDYNIVMILDISGSMGSKTDPNSKYSLLMNAVKNLMADFHDYTGGDIKVHIVPFSTTAIAGGTFTVTADAGYNSAISFINNMSNAGGYTNYESALQSAISYLQGSGPISGAETYTYFVSDGQPNRYVTSSSTSQSGDEATSMGQIQGTDGTNEVATLKALSTEVIGVGIDISAKIANINLIDSDGIALNITDPNDLSAALSGASPLNKLADVGGDTIVGNAGNDLIFGDSLFTDTLAAAHGLTTLPGAGWEVFAKLEAGESALNPGWSRADTVAYIKANAVALSAESVGSNNITRAGGNDTLNGGDGDDTIFGQEGNDLITGGAGSDILYGGTGADTFALNAVGSGVDTIMDFNIGQDDLLNIHNILSGYDPLADVLSDFVRVTNNGSGDTLVQINANGAVGGTFQTVAVLEGVSGVNLDDLTNNGNLIA